MLEIEWKTEVKSTTPNTARSGSSGASEKDVDGAESAGYGEPVGPRCIGEMRVRLMEGGTVDVSFPFLGLWTEGRIEQAMVRMFRAVMVARQQERYRAAGLPETINSDTEKPII